jgi:hypothetical protein
VRVLLSDLLWPGDPAATLRLLTPAAASVVLVQIVAKADLEPPREGNLRLVDCETGAELDVRCTPATAARYHDAMTGHLAAWGRSARDHGSILVSLEAEPLVETWQPAPLLEAGVLEVLP